MYIYVQDQKEDIMRILLDGMGGDNAPYAVCEGAVLAANEIEHEIVIIGDEEKINEALRKICHGNTPENISVVHASEVITNDEAPALAIRRKKDSSIVKGMNMLKTGEGDLFISAGSTGALLAGGLLLIGRIKGIDRPAICTIYPILGGQASLLCDAGANAECKPRNLVDFAVMSSIYMEKVLGRQNPTVKLVNIGEEEQSFYVLIAFKEGSFVCVLPDGDGVVPVSCWNESVVKLEVIGNKLDDPELFEERGDAQ